MDSRSNGSFKAHWLKFSWNKWSSLENKCNSTVPFMASVTASVWMSTNIQNNLRSFSTGIFRFKDNCTIYFFLNVIPLFLYIFYNISVL